MWWVPIVTALVLALVFLGLNYWGEKRHLRVSRIYRARYLQLIAQLEELTGTVNKLHAPASMSADVKALDYFEGCLRILETLLGAIRKVPPFGNEPSQLNSGYFLVRDCRTRLERLERALAEANHGAGIDFDTLYGRKSKKSSGGCYFCSRPLVAGQFSLVRAKIDTAVQEVWSCLVCRDELQTTKKVKVLFFLRDGRPVHWSEMPNYQPNEDYWNINKRDVIRKTTKLELVKTHKEGPRDGLPLH